VSGGREPLPERPLATSRLASAVDDLAVFAYASLVNPESVEMTLGREVELAGRARLRGWRRRWTACRDNLASEKTFALPDGSVPGHCLGLNVEPGGGAEAEGPNGALIAVSAAELERLDLRELRYDRIDVTTAVDPLPPGFDRVFAYTAKPERYAPVAPPDAVVIAAYARAVEQAFAALGRRELERYRRTTKPSPAPVVEATLVHDRIPAGNPRRW
jgi:hypothetical protein